MKGEEGDKNIQQDLRMLHLVSRQAVAASGELDDEGPSAAADWRHSGCSRVVARAGAAPSAANGEMVAIAVAVGPWAALPADVGTIGVGPNVVVAVARRCSTAPLAPLTPLTSLAAMSTMATVTGRFGSLLVPASSNRNRKSLFDTSLADALPRHHAIVDGKVVADVVSRLGCLLHGHILGRVGSVRCVFAVVHAHTTDPALSGTASLKRRLVPATALTETGKVLHIKHFATILTLGCW